MWHTGSGRIVYDPWRGKMKRRTEWWCVIETSRSITAYYRHTLQQNGCLKNLVAPTWDAHISILRGEKPYDNKMHLWEKYDGELVTFKYSHEVEHGNNPRFWQVEVQCPYAMNIRKEMGFKTDWPLHLTIGVTPKE